MKRLLVVALFFMLVPVLVTACGGEISLEPSETPFAIQPEKPVDEPYPPLGGEVPADTDSDSGKANPYPGPQQPAPVDSEVFIMPTDQPYNPVPGDEDLIRGNVFLGDSAIRLLESFPVQVELHLSGSLPTPCHQLRAILEPPDEKNRIKVELYSLTEPDAICLQVLEPFEAVIPLGTYTHGSFTVWVNDEQIESFDLP